MHPSGAPPARGSNHEDSKHRNHLHLHQHYHRPAMDAEGLPTDHPSNQPKHQAMDSSAMDRGELSSAIIDMHSQLAKKNGEIQGLQTEVDVLRRMKEEKAQTKGRV
ncbi:hypothetical protein TeGR_g6483 [Tetraparma gracilis]|uniref:Uncharacterized protein n=1 Tax=Tetraparma gracilis TaxID=2962635 RepID=A0ABQ6N6F7_9STRA|nr:hypothetical protein TeGR_g6483 [Tetraparma gracilis]